MIEPTLKRNPLSYYPRTMARRLVDELKHLGYSLFSSYELEFVLVHRDTMKPVMEDSRMNPDAFQDNKANWSNIALRNSQCSKFSYQVMRQMAEVGIHFECMESESGISQMEFHIEPAFGIRAADDAHTFKLGVKEIARQHGYIASFMSLPYVEDHMNENVSSLQVNHSIWDAEGKVPLTYDPDKAHSLSDVAEHWLAGILEHVRALTILTSPTFNCMKVYTRNADDNRIPHHATWGIENKETAVRVKVDGPKSAYFEPRFSGGASHPYIALAAIIAAGMDGIKRKLPLPPPENVEKGDIPPGTALNTDDYGRRSAGVTRRQDPNGVIGTRIC